jgi:DNA-binding transcriptional regulator/RsmH inhibitor MraZ
MIKIPLQHTATTIICCKEMLAYDEFLLMPSSDPHEWIVSTVGYWEAIQQQLKQLLIMRQTSLWLQKLVLSGMVQPLHRTGNEVLVPEHIIQNSQNCVEQIKLFFRDIEKS